MENTPLNISKTLLDLASVSEVVLRPSHNGLVALKAGKLPHSQRSLLERVDGFRSIEQLLAMSGDLIGVHAALGNLLASGLVATESGAVADAAVFAVSEPRPVAAPAPPARTAPPKAAAAVAKPVPASTSPARPAALHASPAPRPAAAPNAVRPAPVPPRADAVPKAPAKVAAQAAPQAMPKPAPAAAAPPAAAKATASVPTELDNAKRLLFQEAKNVLGNGAVKLKPRIDACGSIEDIYDLIVKFQEHLATTGKANPDVFLDRLTRALAAARQQTATSSKLRAAE